MQYKKYLQSLGLSKSTQECYMRHTLDFISFLDKDNTEAENATSKEMTAYLQVLNKRGLGQKTKGIQINSVKHFFNWQIEQGKRENNPAMHVKIRGKKRQALYPILDVMELDALYTNYQMAKQDDERSNRNWWDKYVLTRKRNKVILSLMIHQGLTTAEVNNLTIKDLDLEQGKIFIAGGRKSEERTLELKSHQMMGLMQWQLTTRKELITLIQSGKNNTLNRSKQDKPNKSYKNNYSTDALLPSAGTGKTQISLFKRLSEELKEQHPKFINFKQVRASVITHWLGKYNLRQVQYMAGHRSINSTERYKANQLDDLKTDIDQFFPLD